MATSMAVRNLIDVYLCAIQAPSLSGSRGPRSVVPGMRSLDDGISTVEPSARDLQWKRRTEGCQAQAPTGAWPVLSRTSGAPSGCHCGAAPTAGMSSAATGASSGRGGQRPPLALRPGRMATLMVSATVMLAVVGG